MIKRLTNITKCLFNYRDLVGNIITTMTCCLIVGQVSNLLRIFTEFQNHLNFLILGILHSLFREILQKSDSLML